MPFGALKGDFGSADDVLRVLDETAAYIRTATNGQYNMTTHNVFVVADLAGFRILQLLQKVCCKEGLLSCAMGVDRWTVPQKAAALCEW